MKKKVYKKPVLKILGTIKKKTKVPSFNTKAGDGGDAFENKNAGWAS